MSHTWTNLKFTQVTFMIGQQASVKMQAVQYTWLHHGQFRLRGKQMKSMMFLRRI